MSHCFASCSTCDAHTVGHWAPATGSTYRLNHSLYHTMGLSGPPAASAQHYGLCDDRMEKMGTAPRKLFEWKTEACDLPRFDRSRACSALSGRQVMIAGDSTAAQLFLSLVLPGGNRARPGHARPSRTSPPPLRRHVAPRLCAQRPADGVPFRSEFNRA